ncbi:MAG TPA: NADAR family protein, partial [Myxococcota bacterium]
MPEHDRASLERRAATGEALAYVFFWKHTPVVAAPDARVLSQWSPHGFTIDGTRYPTAEHYMMAEKARLFGDEDARAKILLSSKPNDVKALGRAVRNYDDKKWSHARFDVVVRGSRAKFSASDALRAYLVSTAPKILVEASPLDTIWGIGLAADAPNASTPSSWRGLNLLGFALM